MNRRGDNSKQAICWDCAKACGRCSWSKLPQHQVKGSRVTYYEAAGWSNGARRGTVKLGRVQRCPEFEEG